MSKFRTNIFSIATTYFELLLVLSSLQKSEFLKLIISFFHHFGCQNEIRGTICVEKTFLYILSTFGSKINEFERKKSGKNEKIPKT